jgi:RNA polymerase sigma-70 factor, ECF subfamily
MSGQKAPTFAAGSVSFVESAASDAALVQRCLGGDGGAFRPLVERYQRVLFTVAVRMLGDEDQAAEAVQTAFVRSYEKLATYDPAHKFFSWLYRILVNECLNVRRARSRFEPVDPTLPSSTDDPHRQAQRAETRAKVQAALGQLRPLYREVVVLRHFAELSYEEIATTIGVPEKTVKSRLHSARQRLGELLLGWGGES